MDNATALLGMLNELNEWLENDDSTEWQYLTTAYELLGKASTMYQLEHDYGVQIPSHLVGYLGQEIRDYIGSEE